MRCKKHPGDSSSSVGVCASCLRHRLLSIMAAQAQKQAQAQAQAQHHQQTPSFPRSVSPYISRRKSDASPAAAAWQFEDHRRRFYSTPQVGFGGGAAAAAVEGAKKKKKRFSSLFFGIFRSKPDKKRDLASSGPISDPGAVSTIDSPSWFPGVIRRKKQIRTFSLEDGAMNNRRACRDRGMSPDEDEHCGGGSSGYSSEESAVGWRQTPARMTPAAARRGAAGRLAAAGGNLSGLAFCLSPLVRASPNRRWNGPPEAAAGEARVPAKPCFSTTASFCKNRSRKLADFGRYR